MWRVKYSTIPGLAASVQGSSARAAILKAEKVLGPSFMAEYNLTILSFLGFSLW